MHETDEDFEKELRLGLRLRDASAGFAERVMERVAAGERKPVRAIRKDVVSPRLAILRWAIAAALLVAVGVGGYSERKRQERVAGERAREQVLLALRITSSTLQAVRDRVVER